MFWSANQSINSLKIFFILIINVEWSLNNTFQDSIIRSNPVFWACMRLLLSIWMWMSVWCRRYSVRKKPFCFMHICIPLGIVNLIKLVFAGLQGCAGYYLVLKRWPNYAMLVQLFECLVVVAVHAASNLSMEDGEMRGPSNAAARWSELHAQVAWLCCPVMLG